MKWRKKGFWPIDSGYKFIIALILGTIPFFLDHQFSFILLAVYLFTSTFLYGARLKDMFKSMAAYLIIILFPYLFGLGMAAIVSAFSATDFGMVYGSFEDVTLRLIQLFLLWYATSLFFFSTSTEEIVGVFDFMLTPLKKMGVPVEDFLKVIMCVVNELKQLGPSVKKSFANSMKGFSENETWRAKIAQISDVLVAFIVDSFQRLDEVEKYVNEVDAKALFTYRAALSKSELALFISFIGLIYIIATLEQTILI